MISSIRIASVGRDLGVQLYNHETLEWQEHLSGMGGRDAVERSADPEERNVPAGNHGDFIRDALSIFNPPTGPKEST